MNAQTSRRVSEGWEWVMAGSLSLASCVVLVLLLLTVARAQAREALRAGCQAVAATGTGVGHACAQEAGRSNWLATGTHVPSCEYCQGGRTHTDAGGGSVWSNLRYETTVLTTVDRRTGFQTRNARTIAITVSVVLVWLLGLRIIIGPLHPSHHLRHGGRWARSF